jgi:WD40 repeat protein/tRNA A-37 threonylcarbamoyl transferase component Bud32
MVVRVRCPRPGCGKVGTIPHDKINHTGRCSQCGTRFAFASALVEDAGRAPEPAQATVAPTAAQATQADATGPARAAGPSSTVGAVPERIGRFQVRARLGAGAFGTVYRAYDPQLEREVALKVPQASALNSPTRVERFLREARAAAQLRHPHIVPLYDAGCIDGQHYLASAFIAGQPLAAACSGDLLPVRDAVAIVRDLAEALAYAHEQGIVHRDVKPANVMLDEKGKPHLMDFGLAARQDLEDRLTHDGAILGTPSYMAPEQAQGQQGEARPASDQYSLGVLLYELLTGRTPFEGPPQLVLYHAINTEPKAPRAVRLRVPRDIDKVCLKAMAKRPEDRYADCQAFADDLRRWLEGEPVRARRLRPWEWLARWAGRNRAVAALTGAVALLVVLGTVVAAVFGLRASAYAWQAARARERAAAHAGEAERQRERADEQTEAAKRNAEQTRQEKERADKWAEEARANAEQTRREKERADEQAAEAKRNAEQAHKERERADRQVEEARAKALRGPQELYLSDMLLAERAVADGNFGWFLELLDRQRPERTGGKDLRGFEWHYLWRRAQKPSFTLKAAEVGGLPVRTGEKRVKKDKKQGKKQARQFTGVAFSPDGSYIAIARFGDPVLLRDARTGAQVRALTLKNRLDASPISIHCLAFSPDGRHIACGGAQQKTRNELHAILRIWDARTGKEVLALEVSATGVAFSADGDRLATTDGPVFAPRKGKKGRGPPGDRFVRIWDARTGKEVFALKGQPSGAWEAAFSPDGGHIAAPAADGFVRIWDARTGKEVLALKGHKGRTLGRAFSPDGSHIACGGDDGFVRIWDARTGKEVLALKMPKGGACSAAFSPTGGWLAAFDVDGLSVWAGATGELALDLPEHKGGAWGVAFSPDGSQVASAGGDGIVRVSDARTGKEALVRAEHKGGAWGVAFSPDGRLASAGGDGIVRISGDGIGKEALALKGHAGGARVIAFDPKGGRLATTDADGIIRVWGADTGKQARAFQGHKGGARGLAFSPKGKALASANADGTVRMWDAQTGKEGLVLRGHKGAALGVAFSPKGDRLASAGTDGAVRMWDAQTGKEGLVLRGHKGAALGVAFSPKGNRLASAGADGTVRVWDAQTGKEALVLRGHTGGVLAVAFSSDGGRLVSASRDWTVKVWDGSPMVP